MHYYTVQVGSPAQLALIVGVTTGLTFATLDSVLVVNDGVVVGTPAADLAMALTEVNSGTAPGVYVLEFTPDRVGTVYLKVVEGAVTNEFLVQVTAAPQVVDASSEGDYNGIVIVGATPASGVVVRCYGSAGTLLVGRTVSNSLGEYAFALPVGEYQLRFSKEGVDFSSVNPTEITVVPNDEVPPRADELLPATASIGDFVAVRGQFFHTDDSEVLFSTTVATPVAISPDGKALLVEVPAGLVLTAIPVRVRKPDPSNPGSYLQSDILTMVRV